LPSKNFGIIGLMSITFDEVYKENFKVIYNFVYIRVLHRETAEDITSQAFLNAFSHFDSFDSERGNVRTWLCGIARNAVADHFRKFTNTHEDPTDELPESPVFDDPAVLKESINREVATVLKLLRPEERELLTMRYVLELNFKEIGDILGISQASATERHRRLIAKCRKIEEGKSLSDFI